MVDSSRRLADRGRSGPVRRHRNALSRRSGHRGPNGDHAPTGISIDPFEVVIAPDGSSAGRRLRASAGWARIVRVDPATGRRRSCRTAACCRAFGTRDRPRRVDLRGELRGTSARPVGFRIDPVTGADPDRNRRCSRGPADVVVAPDGSLIVSDGTALGGQARSPDRPATGVQTVIARGPVPRAGRARDDPRRPSDRGRPGGARSSRGADRRRPGDRRAVGRRVGGLYFHNPRASLSAPPPRSTLADRQCRRPYTVEEGTTVTLDASEHDRSGPGSGLLAYLWDLNCNGVFGETGLAASNGDRGRSSPRLLRRGLARRDAP